MAAPGFLIVRDFQQSPEIRPVLGVPDVEAVPGAPAAEDDLADLVVPDAPGG